MKRFLSILTAIAMVLGAVGFVRPEAARQAIGAWAPVVDSMIRVPLRTGEHVSLSGRSDYVIFLEGPSGHPLWDAPNHGIWVDLLDLDTHLNLRSTPYEASYDLGASGRRGVAIAEVTVAQDLDFELNISGGPLDDAFEVSIGPSTSVDESAWRAKLWGWGSIGACVLLGLAALLVVRKPQE